MTENEPGWVAKSIVAILSILRRCLVYSGDRYFCDTCGRELYSDKSECCVIESIDNWKDGYGNVLYQTPHRSSVIRVEKSKHNRPDGCQQSHPATRKYGKKNNL